MRLLGFVNSVATAPCASNAAGSGSRGLGMKLGSGWSRRYLMSRSEGLDLPRDPQKQVCGVPWPDVCCLRQLEACRSQP